MYLKEYSDFDSVAQLETVLRVLSASVTCLDAFHHQDLLSSIFQMSLWVHKTNVMDALVGLIISLAVTSGKYLDSCLNMLITNFIPPSFVMRKISQPVMIYKKREVLSQRLSSYVDNLLKLENSSIGKVVGGNILAMVMERLRDLDSEIVWDDILQDDSSRSMFDMELEDAVEEVTINDGDEIAAGSLNQSDSDGSVVSGLLDKLMVLCFDHLETCKIAGRLDELTSLESVLSHKLNPLMVCLPSVVSEFLKQAKAGGLFIVSESFIFDDLLESELSRAFGGFERLDTFFPFDPCLLKSSNSFIAPNNFVYWSMVKPTYDVDEDEEEDELCAEVIVNGDEDMSEDESCDDEEVEILIMRCVYFLLNIPSCKKKQRHS